MKTPHARPQASRPRLRVPLYGKILACFTLNLAVLALLLWFFLQAQFQLGLDWMLSGEPGERIAAMGDRVTQMFSRLPEASWTERLESLSAEHEVIFALFDGQASQVHGQPLEIPVEVTPRLLDRRPAQNRPARPISKRPADAPPKPRFMLRAGQPARYWAGVHLDLATGDGRPLSLVMAARSIRGGGLFVDLGPWLGLAATALLVSALLWMPLVRGITGFIRTLNTAADRIAHGQFDERIGKQRSDELGELATSVNTMAAQLGDYMAQQRRITADVAHELCSPIARMQMALGVVEQRSTPEQARYLEKLDRELQHMAKLVEEVLAFSKAATLPDRELPEDIAVRELIESLLAREAPETSVKLEIGQVRLHSLRNALDRALSNVVRNALRYAGSLEIQVREEHGQVQIHLLDDGPGVPEEALPRLFEPFYRPEAARGRSTGGSGLGLAITQRCVEACGGRVSARNRKSGGLAVDITLPV